MKNNFTARRNPYIIGRPIFEPEKFFGREELFQFIEDNLIRDVKFIFLHGQRRIGRSSVLQQIPHKIAQDKFVFVTFDLQEHSQSSLGEILHSLAEAIAENLELDSEIIRLPSQEEFKNNPDIFSHDFLPQIYHKLGNKNLVLLLDEFDVASGDNSIINQGGSFFRYLQLLLKQQEKLFIIPVLGRIKDDLQNLLDLFKDAPFQEVGLLNDLSARRLITIPAQGILDLEVANFDRALTLYTRAYQADPIRNKEGLLLALEKYGQYLIKKGELSKAKIHFKEVLEIESDRKSARDKLREIEAIIEQQQLEIKPISYKQKLQINSVILFIVVGIIAIIGNIFGNIIYQSSTSCPQGQQKLNDECVTTVTDLPIKNDPIESNISGGDRTLFFTIPNSYRDQGIEAFQQGNYTQAIKLFQQAITANRSDPEVRIYYNNAIARQRGNPFTLAVVVPAENGRDRSLEILRGIAQSQEQFNANGGQYGRSLEILIANDGDNPTQAEEIAQELVNDKSVLGVIGHGSSNTTKAALNIYEQAGIPFISPTSASNTLEGKNFFRTTPSDAASGKKLAEYAIDSGLNKVVIFYNTKDVYSNTLRQEFRTYFKGQIISLTDLTDPTLNIEQEFKVSASKQVQAVILFPDVEHTATALDIAKVNLDKNLGLKLLGVDTLYSARTLQNGENAVEGLVVAVPWFREAPQARDFSQAAKQIWGGDISWRTATSYDAAQAFINSLSPQPSRETILQKLPQIDLKAKLTSGNELKFQNGERQSEAVLVKVESGKFTCLDKCSP
ncbi:MAG: ABC transporter substrate-binding protein [Desmonostoc geniculatum HA4340-LM1]|jgi:ABC-type branched-subunit amino acid transport system substrate-binding protein|nr:ABC transporter substrate-binding protein [Desmonostoc geniculatum HA4340-LM1]